MRWRNGTAARRAGRSLECAPCTKHLHKLFTFACENRNRPAGGGRVSLARAPRTRRGSVPAAAALAAAAGSWDGLRASIAHDTAAGAAPALPAWVQSVRALMRPAITVGLLAAVVALWRDLPRALPPAEAAETGQYLARALTAAATTAVVWWFGDRSLSAPADKRR